MAITDGEAKEIGETLGIDYNVVPFEWWKNAMAVELEHGSKLSKVANVTDDDLLTTGRIALAHLIEYPDYYQRLEEMEKKAELEWSTKYKAAPYNKFTVQTDDWWILQSVSIAILILIIVFLVYRIVAREPPAQVEKFSTPPEVLYGDPITPGTY